MRLGHSLSPGLITALHINAAADYSHYHRQYRLSDSEGTWCSCTINTWGALNAIPHADALDTWMRGQCATGDSHLSPPSSLSATCSVMSLSHGEHILYSNSSFRPGRDPVTYACFFHTQFTWEVLLSQLDSFWTRKNATKGQTTVSSDGHVIDHKPGKRCQVYTVLSHLYSYLKPWSH